MSSGLRFVLACVVLATSASVALADVLVVGGPANTVSGFPFARSAGAPGTRYQQAYAAGSFSGAMSITEIRFFRVTDGELRDQDYALSLSTVAADIDSLSNADFDSNLGADNALFAPGALAGAAPAVLTFAGGPFLYDPAQGNLLLDFAFTNIGANNVLLNFAARDDAVGVFSRYHDFGTGNVGIGLVTQFRFDSVAPVPEPRSTLLVAAALLAFAAMRRAARDGDPPPAPAAARLERARRDG